MKREIKFRCWFAGMMANNLPSVEFTEGNTSKAHIDWEEDDTTITPPDTWTGHDDLETRGTSLRPRRNFATEPIKLILGTSMDEYLN